MLERRVQILLDEARYAKLAREAAARGVSIASVVRAAIDRLPADPDRRQRAVAAILQADPMPVPADPAALRAELDAARERSFR